MAEIEKLITDEPRKFNEHCCVCGYDFTYTAKDVITREIGIRHYVASYVKCPTCGHNVFAEQFENEEFKNSQIK